MRAERVAAESLAARDAGGLAGAVLLAPVRVGTELLAKGTRLDGEASRQLHAAALAGRLAVPLRLGWPDPGDLHEDDAAAALAAAIAGPGVARGAPRQSRVDLTARTDGVLRVQVEALARLNRVDPLEVFTLFHGQAVRAGQVVASTKVAPHLVAGYAVAEGVAVARAAAPLVDVAPYLPLPVAAVAAEPLAAGGLERFEAAARAKVEGLGGTFVGCYPAARRHDGPADGPGPGAVLDELRGRGVKVILVGGVSAGDPLSPMFEALAERGGAVLRRGVPAHPGSMIWFARLGGATLMGLPQCGMFSMATAADLVLPRLLTGEAITAEALADLGHGGLLGRDMRFRLPDYARELETPTDP